MTWQDKVLKNFGSGAFAGITLGKWCRVLRDNHLAVDPPYWGRAAAITLGSVWNTMFHWLETARFERSVRQTKIHPPIFILGIWRSGTTHLHNLLAQDDRFAYPNFYQVAYPHTFLCTEKISARLMRSILPARRPQDNMRFGVLEPAEEEYALCSLLGRSLLLSLAFPRNASFYDAYLTLRDLSDAELREWKKGVRWFVQKLSFKYGRPLLLKSPGNTGRIKVLLDLFPEAKFVHIHRNPYAVFQSNLHAARTLTEGLTLQRPDFSDLENRTIRHYQEVFKLFFEERQLIPEGRFCEVNFEELEEDPVDQVRHVYTNLGLPDFNHVEPRLRGYVESLSGYDKNAFSELPKELRDRISEAWRPCFTAWGYGMY